jgi:pyruvate/2-oxoacid:ferredoxin oxidoreductase beta subunit
LAQGRRAGELFPQQEGNIHKEDPGCGKSGLMNALIKIRMVMLNIKYEPAFVGSITPDDKYHF